MKDLYLTLPPFAPDYGGACEVMYELGGLVLIHDASGCTVNYVSFDEPRWHKSGGMVYSSGLTEIDAVMGNDDVLIDKALKAAELLHPSFIAVVGSSVPMIVGTDFAGIAAEMEERSGIPCFGFDANGIHSYIYGASQALEAFVRRFAGEKTESRGTLVLGLLPMDDADLNASQRMMNLFDDRRAVLSMNCSLDDFRNAQNAEKCAVVSSAGLKAAEYLKQTYGIPYETGLPLKPCHKAHGSLLVIGEDIRAHSLAQALGNADGLDLFSPEGLCRYHTVDEDEIAGIISGYENVIADPCFAPMVKGNFIPMPTVSVSGGIFRETVSVTDTEAVAAMLI
ncbi:MAG: hypothetical protein E7190_05085 [Erysipelotrichaceae bacterium]|nr:hypothetical protein [Erysipelotrichaceae bacterium]